MTDRNESLGVAQAAAKCLNELDQIAFELEEWIRQPDWAEDFSLEDTVNWINARPLQIVSKLRALAAQPPAAGCGTPGCIDPNCEYGKGSLRCQTCGAPIGSGIFCDPCAEDQPLAAPVETCPNCNGTKRAIYFSEQSYTHEYRECHVCRSSAVTSGQEG